MKTPPTFYAVTDGTLEGENRGLFQLGKIGSDDSFGIKDQSFSPLGNRSPYLNHFLHSLLGLIFRNAGNHLVVNVKDNRNTGFFTFQNYMDQQITGCSLNDVLCEKSTMKILPIMVTKRLLFHEGSNLLALRVEIADFLNTGRQDRRGLIYEFPPRW